jgi:putative peptidoglycan lipid II flippase
VFRRKSKEGDRSAWALASKMMTLAAIFMSIESAWRGLRQTVDRRLALARPADAELTIRLTQVMYPFICWCRWLRW